MMTNLTHGEELTHTDFLFFFNSYFKKIDKNQKYHSSLLREFYSTKILCC